MPSAFCRALRSSMLVSLPTISELRSDSTILWKQRATNVMRAALSFAFLAGSVLERMLRSDCACSMEMKVSDPKMMSIVSMHFSEVELGSEKISRSISKFLSDRASLAVARFRSLLKAKVRVQEVLSSERWRSRAQVLMRGIGCPSPSLCSVIGRFTPPAVQTVQSSVSIEPLFEILASMPLMEAL